MQRHDFLSILTSRRVSSVVVEKRHFCWTVFSTETLRLNVLILKVLFYVVFMWCADFLTNRHLDERHISNLITSIGFKVDRCKNTVSYNFRANSQAYINLLLTGPDPQTTNMHCLFKCHGITCTVI